MFRRKDEDAYDPNDLLSEVMSDSDEAIETQPNDSQNESVKLKPAQPQSSSSSASSSTASTPSQPSPAQSESVRPQPAPMQTASLASPPAPKPGGFRPQMPASAAVPAPRPAPAANENRMAPAASPAAPVSANPKSSKRVLTVGHDINMDGKIKNCDRLMIEGSVDATLEDVHTVELTQTGSFKGTAEIEDAEISGTFEGDLIVNGRLTIYATGKVSGNVAYGEIEIERGGQLLGTVKTIDQIKEERSKQKKAA